jgi:hypothetical protein
VSLDEEKIRRLVAAVAQNLGGWMEQAEEIAEAAHPATGNKARALHLKKGMAMAKLALERLMEDAERSD